MCLSCGRGDANDNHGNPANITARDIDAAAVAANIRPVDVARHIYDGVKAIEQKMSFLEALAQR
jgi:hypothetical protein